MGKHIKIEKLPETELKNKGIFDWGIWEKEVSRFDWHYDRTEECYLLEGHVIVEWVLPQDYERYIRRIPPDPPYRRQCH